MNQLKKLNPYYFTNGVLKAGFNDISDSHHIKQKNSKKNNSPKHLEIDKKHVNKKIDRLLI